MERKPEIGFIWKPYEQKLGAAMTTRHLLTRHSCRDLLSRVLGFAGLYWRQGLKYGCRGQYWRQLFGIPRKNPSRFAQWAVLLVMGEDMFRLRESLTGKGDIVLPEH